MVFPYTPEDVAVELRLGGAWVDLQAAGKIKLSDGIRINRGKTGSTAVGFSSPPPSGCQFTIKNNDGVYSPDNPLSAYYQDLGLGTEVRVACRVAKDAFTRTTSNGWGTADVGGAWTINGTAANFATGGANATITMSAANTTNYAYQAGQTYASHDVAATMTFSMSNVTGAAVSAGIILGWVSTSDYFVCRLNVSTAEVMTVDVEHRTTGTTISFPVTITSFAYTGQAIRMRAQLAGETIRVRVWPAASAEPLTWDVEESYSFDALLDRSKGAAGFRVNAATGNTNVPFTVTVDDWEVRSNRYAGSIASLEVQTDVTGKQVETAVECGGPRRRLGQGTAPVLSPFRRANAYYVDTINSHPAHLQYFPGEDAAGASQVASGFDNGAAMILASGTPTFASTSTVPGSLPIIKMANGVRFFGPRTGNTTSTGEAQLLFCLTVPSGGEVDAATLAQLQLSGTCGFVDVVYGTSGSGRIYLVFYGQDRVAVHTSGDLVTGLNNTTQYVSVELTQSGADISYRVDAYPVGALSSLAGSGTCSARTIGAVRGFFSPPYGQVTACSMGHWALRNEIINVLTFQLSINAYSFPDLPINEIYVETSLWRVQRLAEEAGVGVTYIRRPNINSDWTDMGEQGVSPVLTLLDESTNADLATLYEDRDVEGFVYRYGRARWNQDAVLTLNIASGQIAPPFRMPKDDSQLLNDVEVKRKDGSSVHVTNATSIAARGRINTSQTLNVWSDTMIADRAYWLLALGTSDLPRMPSMQLDLARAARDSTQLYLDMLAVDIDDRIVSTNPNALVTRADLDLLASGYTEILAGKKHTIAAACVPAGPYAVAEAADTTGDTNPWLCRLDTDGATVNTLANAGATSLSVATPSGPLWSTVADDYPLYLDVAGVQVRATACTGAASPQTFTVDALPVARAAGLSVSVWHLPVLGF